MGFIVAGALAALVALMLAITGSSAARRWLAGALAFIEVLLLAVWFFQN
jgi:hypothetical protein